MTNPYQLSKQRPHVILVNTYVFLVLGSSFVSVKL